MTSKRRPATRQSTTKKRKSYKDEEDEPEDISEEEVDEDEEEVMPKSKRQRVTKPDVVLVGKWTDEDDDAVIVFNHKDQKHSALIAGFDFDSTLVKPKGAKRKFAQNAADWMVWDEKVPKKLQELHDKGYKIVIFTNQEGITKGKVTKEDIQERIHAFIEHVKVPVQVFAAPAADHFRKPSTGMWAHMVKSHNGGIEIDMKKSFYVGDAAGRPKGWKPKLSKDHSCGDRKFALNVGVDFHTPEEYFLAEEKYTDFELGFDPKAFHEKIKGKTPHNIDQLVSKTQELVIFVGPPASGKSTFAKKFEKAGYVIVNRDTLKTIPKCKKAVEEALGQKKSVVVDNTNPDEKSRAEFISVAQAKKVPVRCFFFKTPRDVAEHLNIVREVLSKGARPHVPGVGYNTYYKKFQEPAEDEGFKLTSIEFIPDLSAEPFASRFLQYT